MAGKVLAATFATLCMLYVESSVAREEHFSPDAVVHTIYSRKPGDVRRFLSKDIIGIQNSVSPSWLYGGFYPDAPKVRITRLSEAAEQASVQVDIDLPINGSPHLRRTLHLRKIGNSWTVDHVRLDTPEGRDIP